MTEPLSIGAYLRAARRKRRFSIDRAAEQTRIRPDYLMRMESDEFDFLAPAYVRGFLKTYARFLRVDPDPLLDEFDHLYNPARFETSQIVALERHGRRHTPREKRMSSWSIAATVAAAAILILAVVGIVTNPEDATDNQPDNVAAENDDEASPSPSPEVTPEATPTVPDEEVVAFADGVDLQIDATNGDCWVDITADGENIFSGMLVQGDSQTFEAEKTMDVVLGFAAGVELTINGRDVGSPGVPDVFTFKLPKDFESLL